MKSITIFRFLKPLESNMNSFFLNKRNVIIFIVLAFACSNKDIKPKNTTLYKHDFTNGHGGWISQLNKFNLDEIQDLDTVGPFFYKNGDTISVNIRNKVVNNYAYIQSPFFYDINHAKPLGAGSSYLLTWLFLGGQYNTNSTLNIPFLDIRDKYLIIDINIHDLKLNEGNLLFWFQTTQENGRWANYTLVSQPLNKMITDTTDSFHKVKIKLPKREEDGWICQGASEREQHRYTCDPNFNNSISKVNYDFGFIIFPITSHYATDRTRNLKIKSIELCETF